MLYIKQDSRGKVVQCCDVRLDDEFMRCDACTTLECAERIAEEIREAGMPVIAVDMGEECKKRYCIIPAPIPGDVVSYKFFSSKFSSGVVTSIDAECRIIITSLNHVYIREGASSTWLKDGKWTMVRE